MTTDTHQTSHAPRYSHGTRRGYLIGSALSVLLTAVPFGMVLTGGPGHTLAISLLVILAAALQIVVHMVCFLDMNTKAEGGWTMMALIFTIILVVISLTGSIWVMYHLNSNMMPSMSDMA